VSAFAGGQRVLCGPSLKPGRIACVRWKWATRFDDLGRMIRETPTAEYTVECDDGSGFTGDVFDLQHEPPAPKFKVGAREHRTHRRAGSTGLLGGRPGVVFRS
jgi:hypothetical protein